MNTRPVASSLTNEEILEALKHLPGWEFKDNKLHKEFRFKNFKGRNIKIKAVSLIAWF